MIDRPLLIAALQSAGLRQPAPDLLATLAPAFTRRPVAKAAPVLMQGSVWDQALIIQTGLVRMHFLRRDGKEFNKNFFTENMLICPLTPAMISAPSLFGITAIEASVLWNCDAGAFRQALDERGQWAPMQVELMARLLTAKLQREHDLLALDGRRRYDAFCARMPDLAARVPLMHLATYLGLTDVSLSRLRRGAEGPRP